MIRRILNFIFVLLFVWASMILGFWIIDSFVVPLELPGIENYFVTSTLKVAVSTGMVLFWLWLWREIVKRMFWRTIKTQQHFTTRSRNNNSKANKE
jgi:hypothetical protein